VAEKARLDAEHRRITKRVQDVLAEQKTPEESLAVARAKIEAIKASDDDKAKTQEGGAGHLRLLTLFPGSFSDPIKCILEQTEPETNDREYEALSYEWGLAGRFEPSIVIDGLSVPVRQNLFDALLHIRLHDKSRCLWIDALCINQFNHTERSRQVQMMRRIYSSASQVVVWLGLAAHDSDVAMDVIQSFDPIQAAEPSLDLQDLHQIKTCQDLCSREYWHRIWIIQEIRLAKQLELRCGTKCTTGSAFEAFYRRVLETYHGKGSEAEAKAVWHLLLSVAIAGHAEWKYGAGLHGTRFYDWLTHCARYGFRSSEPRDMVYAILGISVDVDESDMLPDYKRDIEHVFIDAMELCKRKMGQQACLATAQELFVYTAGRLGIDEKRATDLYQKHHNPE
jgi:hypothetical protein